MSLGEDRVRVKFNPDANSLVDDLKQRTAKLIDSCAVYANLNVPGEEKRLWSLAMTAYEEAAMWAVKAATYDAVDSKPVSEPPQQAAQ